MNRSQLVFVIIVNALFTLLVASSAFLIYNLRRPDTEVPINLEVATPSPGVDQVSPTPTLATSISPSTASLEGEEGSGEVIVPRTYTIREGDTLGDIATAFWCGPKFPGCLKWHY